MERHDFEVFHEDDGKRIDIYLASKLPDLSRRKVRAILDVGGCYVNNRRMHIASRQVHKGDKVRVEFTLDGLSKTKQKKFLLSDGDILFDDKNILAINKPPGLPSQATRDQDIMHAETCLREWLISKGRKASDLVLVHRLDKETSGILLFACTKTVATTLTDAFRNRTVKKAYLAVVCGSVKEREFTVSCHLTEIDKRSGRVSIVRSGGRSSLTRFEVIESSFDDRLHIVKCFPETGRSHQIRVHLESVGLPILGDKRYSSGVPQWLPPSVCEAASQHHMLHAERLGFSLALQEIGITASPPQTMTSILDLIINRP
jgi:23S rRNA pseudouridine1911/1915/1917 synthase